MELGKRTVRAVDAGTQLSRIFEECTSVAALRRRYRQLASAFHPDTPGGNEETFQSVVRAYESRLKTLQAQNPLDVELQDALAELADVLTAIAATVTQKALARTLGENAYRSMTRAARTGYLLVAGMSEKFLKSTNAREGTDGAVQVDW